MPLKIQVHSQISQIDAQQWDALVENHQPFLSHAFLQALEQHHCASPRFGWHPQHLAIYHKNTLIAAMPLYEKHNSYGEFVFDQAWSNAWTQMGLAYFPKLVCAVPYSPVSGQRFLVRNLSQFPLTLDETACKYTQEYLTQQLWAAAIAFAQRQAFSGLHILFAQTSQQTWLAQNIANQPFVYTRHNCHFHWFNQNYTGFDDFLAQLTPKKRKNIRQERQSVARAGVTFRRLNGHTATAQDWEHFGYFYIKTFTEKWSTPTLNTEFFKAVAQALPNNVLLVLADKNGQCIAGSLMYYSDTTLFGRHWGCIEEVNHLHFEACYYQGIEFAIERGLQVFEPGAGGEHKIARGFVPIETQSTHWLNPLLIPPSLQSDIDQALQRFTREEQQQNQDYIRDCQTHNPYKTLSV